MSILNVCKYKTNALFIILSLPGNLMPTHWLEKNYKVFFLANIGMFGGPTCAYARMAHIHHFLYVCHLTKIQTRQKVTRQKVLSLELFGLQSPKRPTVALCCYRSETKPLLNEAQSKVFIANKGGWAHFNVKLNFSLLEGGMGRN